jgi:hypothetical protein
VVELAARLPLLHAWLQTTPPTHLWHYTSPEGLLGIAKTAQIWGSHAYWLNDAQEQEIARGFARQFLDHAIQTGNYSDSDERHRLDEMRKHGTPPQPNKQAFSVSFSAKADELSQWRAYCPDAAGYAIGFPSVHLRAVGEEQGFYLGPCVYNTDPDAYQIVAEIVSYHRQAWQLARSGSLVQATETATRGLYEDLGRWGPLFKHFSFSDEQEWRLISVVSDQDPRMQHRAGADSVILTSHWISLRHLIPPSGSPVDLRRRRRRSSSDPGGTIRATSRSQNLRSSRTRRRTRFTRCLRNRSSRLARLVAVSLHIEAPKPRSTVCRRESSEAEI